MKRVAFTFTLCFFSLIFTQEAQEKDLTQSEFYDLIVNQTMIGEWAGRPYTQTFFEDGRTTYQEENSNLSWGTWRIREDGQYCSVWPPSPRESCYKVTLRDDQFIWHSGTNRYASQLAPSEESKSD